MTNAIPKRLPTSLSSLSYGGNFALINLFDKKDCVEYCY